MSARRHRYKLPPSVQLPKAAIVATQTARFCLGGPSRALIFLWRQNRDFPPSFKLDGRWMISTDALERWLIAQGIHVERL